jgi:hypothetical protein
LDTNILLRERIKIHWSSHEILHKAQNKMNGYKKASHV